jgi:hypothetical protein
MMRAVDASPQCSCKSSPGLPSGSKAMLTLSSLITIGSRSVTW